MKKYLEKFILIALLTLVLPMVALAATYTYTVPIQIFNNSTNAYTNIPILVTLNNTQLANLGYIDSDGLNTEIDEGSTAREYLVVGDKLGIFIPSFYSYQTRIENYKLGYSPERSSFPIVMGVGGNVTVDDSASFELGGNFTIDVKGWIDTDSCSGKNIIYKEDAFKLWVSDIEEITVAILGGGDAETKSVIITDDRLTSQDIRIEVVGDSSVNMTMTIWDGTGTQLGINTTALDSETIPNNANTWYLFQNDVMPYVEYLKAWA